jgi:hypothetical protein
MQNVFIFENQWYYEKFNRKDAKALRILNFFGLFVSLR